MSVAKVTRNYQVTIPRDVRLVHNISIGDTLVFSSEGEKIEVLKFKQDALERAFGLWSGLKETGIDYKRRVRNEWKQREQRLNR